MPDQQPDQFDLNAVDIAPPADDDHAAVKQLFHEGLQEGHLRENDTGADIENLWHAYFDDDGASGFWIARYQERIIGMIGVQHTSENTAEIRRLRVHDDFRRQGVGTRLMEQALMFCQDKGYLKVVLDVRIERGPAIALFEKFGFTLARTRDLDGRRMLDFYVDLYREPNSGN